MGLTQKFKSNPFGKAPAITKLIVLNVAVFAVFKVIFWLTGLDKNLGDIGHHWLELPMQAGQFIKQPWTLISYAFYHTSMWHLLFNMFMLYWFGSIFADFSPPGRVWVFYFAGAITGAALAIIAYNFIPAIRAVVIIPYMLGASAAIMCIVAAAATLVPEYEWMFFFGLVKIKYLALAFVLIDFLSMPAGNAGGKISHLGGALAGYLLIKQLKRGNDLSFKILKNLNKFGGLLFKRATLKVVHRRKEQTDQPSQAQIDSILDKISQSGYESLTGKEKEILFKASKND